MLGRLLGCLLLLITSWSFAVAQKKVEDPDTWLIRATSITEDLLKDAVSLTPNERALLWARIGRAWVKDDPERAETSFRRAVDIVASAPDQEKDIERRQRLDTARSLLKIISPNDSKLRLRLEALFASDENGSTGNRELESAEGMVAAAMAIVDSNPQRAFDLGVTSLRLAKTYKLAPLLWKLRKRDSTLADPLFDHALAAAKVAFDAEMLSWLGQYAFNGQIPSVERRTALLSVMAEGLLRNSVSPSGQAEACQLAVTVAPLLNQFLLLLPVQWGAVRAATQRCLALVPTFARETVENSLRDQPLKTVAELESEADKASGQEIRDEYLTRAATLAAEQKNFDGAISLLDRISDHGRKQLGGGWESWRWEYASSAAKAYLKAGDRSGMHKVIAATPSILRAYVQIAMAQELTKANDKDSAFALLSEARQRLAQSNGTEVVYNYFSLLSQYESLMPIDTLNVLNEAVKAINRSEKSDSEPSPSTESEASLLSDEILLSPYKVPFTLMEREEPGIRMALSSIEPPTKRVAIRLNLLEASLARHRTLPSRKEIRKAKG